MVSSGASRSFRRRGAAVEIATVGGSEGSVQAEGFRDFDIRGVTFDLDFVWGDERRDREEEDSPSDSEPEGSELEGSSAWRMERR